MQETTPDLGPSTDPAPAPPQDGALRDELAKWRERVPKLAAALRQRAEEAATLRAELERLQQERAGERDTRAPSAASIRARDELIAELNGKLDDLTERHRAAEGELHSRRLAMEALEADVAGWKEKWQSLAQSLDQQALETDDHNRRLSELEAENATLRSRLAEQVAAAEAGQRALDEAVEERDSLRRRNEQLFETTELANRQIGSLTESLVELRETLGRLRDEHAAVAAERDAAVRERRAALAERDEAIAARDALEQRVAVAEEAIGAERHAVAALTDDLQVLCAAAISGAEAAAQLERRLTAELDERLADAHTAREAAVARADAAEARSAERERVLEAQRQEIARLTGVVESAQRRNDERERERRALADQIQTLESRRSRLEEQLRERSELVVTLEQDQRDQQARLAALERERDELESARLRAERHAREHAEHITALDGKLERQQALMADLERELVEAREEQARARAARPAESERDAEVQALREQVRKLEAMVRERTEALNRHQWQRELADRDEPPEAAAMATDLAAPPDRASGDARLLVVLNQQLDSERAENSRLLERVRALEAALAEGGGAPAGDDDLTRIHGVGHKLAEQLNELGIYRLEQLAELDEAALNDERHILHPHRGRILRDGWIDQAARLIGH
jgi:predicted flap endonuclease-1-like 5' DNA nuclease